MAEEKIFKKAVLVASNDLPIFSENGVSVYLWSLTRALLRKNFKVYFISINTDYRRWTSVFNCDSLEEITRILKDGEIDAYLLTPKPKMISSHQRLDTIRRTFFPKSSDFYNGHFFKNEIKHMIQQIQPDLVFAWMANAITSALPDQSDSYRLIGLITDLDPLVRQNRMNQWKDYSLRGRYTYLRKKIMDSKLPKIYVDLLKKCDRIVCNASHHTEWIAHHDISNVKYFPIAVIDRLDGDLKTKIEQRRHNNLIKKITMVGNVEGIATLTGLVFFVNEILPGLTELRKKYMFELQIIGKGNLEERIASSLSQLPWIRRVGFIDDISSAFLSSDIFLVPTPISLGFRTRIAEAFSYGSCVVAHQANADGMPELVNNENILLARTGQEMLYQIESCLKSLELRESLGISARKTYEEKYEGNAISDSIVDYCL